MDKKSIIRLVLTFVLICGLVAIGRFSPAHEYLSLENLRSTMQNLGWWGVAFFFVAFTVGELISVPGLVFVVVAAVVYGPISGGIIAYVGAIGSVTVSFIVIRTVGGKPLGKIKWRFFERMMTKLEDRPTLTVAILRIPLALAAPLNYALALSPIGFRHYFVGSAIGSSEEQITKADPVSSNNQAAADFN